MNIDWKNTDREFCKEELLGLLKGLEGKDEQFKTIMHQLGEFEAVNIKELIEDIENETEVGKQQIDQLIKGKKQIKKLRMFGFNPDKFMNGGK